MPLPKRENIMLCYPAEPKRVANLGETFIAQPKLNGERCRVEWFAGEPCLVSSYGNVFKGLEHIQAAIIDLCTSQIDISQLHLDGELYVHGWSREQIHSVVSRKENAHPRAGEMQFHIFDMQDNSLPQITRLGKLEDLFPQAVTGPLHLVPCYKATQSNWMEYCQVFCNDGYEGIILRHPFAFYENKRSLHCLKYKPTETDEYEILDVLEAISIHGEPKGMVGAFLVKGDDGTPFEVGAGKISHKDRIALWEKRQKLTGLALVVKHETIKTTNGVPIAAVAVHVKGA